MGHTLIRNRKTGAVWPCPDKVLDAALSTDDPFLGPSWVKAGKDAEPTTEPTQPAGGAPARAATTAKEQ